MEITWYGHSCFRITERGRATVVTDPFGEQLGYEVPRLKADIAAISHDSPNHAALDSLREVKYVIDGPGEYEIGGVFITGVQTNGTRKDNQDEPRNTLYLINYNSINVLHLGDLDRVPTQTEVEHLGPVHIALIPVGGYGGLNAAKAAEVVSLLEPNIVIPMHYATPGLKIPLDPVSRFLKEMGLGQIEPVPSFKVTSLSSLPEETQVILLDHPSS